MWKNYYHHCDVDWTDIWDSCCNDECPVCGCKEIEPYRSVDVTCTGVAMLKVGEEEDDGSCF